MNIIKFQVGFFLEPIYHIIVLEETSVNPTPKKYQAPYKARVKKKHKPNTHKVK